MLISSWDTLSDVLRNDVLPAILASCSPVKLIHKINHHNHRLVSAELCRRRDRCDYSWAGIIKERAVPPKATVSEQWWVGSQRRKWMSGDQPLFPTQSVFISESQWVFFIALSMLICCHWPLSSKKVRILSCLTHIPIAALNSKSAIYWVLNIYCLNKWVTTIVIYL